MASEARAAGSPAAGRALRRGALLVFGLTAAVYLFTGRGYLSTYDYYNRFLVTRSIVERGAVDIPERIGAVHGPDGRFYSPYGFGESLLFIPFYVTGRAIAWMVPGSSEELAEQAACSALFALATAGAAALVLVIACESLGASPGVAVGCALIFAFATPAWPYSKWHNEQPLETFFLLASLRYALRCRLRSHDPLRAGFAAMLGMVCRLPMAMAVPAIAAVCAAGSPRRWVAAAGVMAAPLAFCALALALNAARFGGALEFGYGELTEQLSTPLPVGALGLLLAPGRGFLFFVPTALLLPLAVRGGFARRHPRALLAFAGVALGYLLLYGSFSAWYGTEAWGPRYLMPLVPLSVLPLCVLLEGPRRNWVLLVAAVGVASQIPPVVASPGRYFRDLDARAVAGHALDPIYDPTLSPLLLHWRSVGAVVRNLGSPGTEETSSALRADDPVRADHHDLAVSLPNFWWIYVLHFGVPPAAVGLALAGLGAAGWASARGLARWVREP